MQNWTLQKKTLQQGFGDIYGKWGSNIHIYSLKSKFTLKKQKNTQV